jgi:hypothetical protein
MTDGDADSPDAGDAEETGANGTTDITAEDLDERLTAAEESLDAAETESDLDRVEATLDDVEADLEAADLPEPEGDDETDPREELETRLSDLRGALEEQRGPYADDVVAVIDEAKTKIADTRWTERGEGEVADAVESFADAVADVLGEYDESREVIDAAVASGDEEKLLAVLDATIAAVEGEDLDADDDGETIASLLEAAETLQSDLEDAQEWDDLEVREKLQAEGFYDVLGHYKDYPPEWSALKEHEKRGNVDMILMGLDMLGSEYMEEHCLEALVRMNDARAFDAMHQRAQKRDLQGIRALGHMGSGAADAVETLVGYVDNDKNPNLQKVVFKALGEIGDDRATQPLADQLLMENDIVRSYAARSLGLLGDTRAIEPLAETLANDENDSVRASAAWALRQIGTRSALEAASEHADDRSFLVQAEVEKAKDALAAEQVA